jgi:FtsH-binding integral membrane protein
LYDQCEPCPHKDGRSVQKIREEKEKIERRPTLSVIALVSFALSFAVARTFTALNPNVIILSPSGFHVHHFWYGIVMLAVGGWLGISYNDPRVNRVAAIIFGAGGGLIGDEAGILLTLRSNIYWAGASYAFIIVFLASASVLILLNKYSRTVLKDFKELLSSRGGFYLAVFLAIISPAFLIDTVNPTVIAVTSLLTIVAWVTILAFLIQRIRKRLSRRQRVESSPMVAS